MLVSKAVIRFVFDVRMFTVQECNSWTYINLINEVIYPINNVISMIQCHLYEFPKNKYFDSTKIFVE